MDKVYGLLSIAAQAGRAVSGSETAMEEVKKKRARLVILTEDASQNTRKLFQDKASYREIPFGKFTYYLYHQEINIPTSL